MRIRAMMAGWILLSIVGCAVSPVDVGSFVVAAKTDREYRNSIKALEHSLPDEKIKALRAALVRIQYDGVNTVGEFLIRQKDNSFQKRLDGLTLNQILALSETTTAGFKVQVE